MKLVSVGSRQFGVSLVGLDDVALLPRACDLSRAYPFVTWGVLAHSEGKSASKFASPAVLDAVASCIESSPHMAFALHLCGPRIGNLLADELALDRLHASCYPVMQISIRDPEPQLAGALLRAMRRFARTRFVVQDSTDLPRWWSPLTGEPNLWVLIDDSLGRGRSPLRWRRADHYTGVVGYAGGLNERNLAAELIHIADAAGAQFWIDIQSGMRDDRDQFSMDRAESVLRICRHWMDAQASPGASTPVRP